MDASVWQLGSVRRHEGVGHLFEEKLRTLDALIDVCISAGLQTLDALIDLHTSAVQRHDIGYRKVQNQWPLFPVINAIRLEQSRQPYRNKALLDLNKQFGNAETKQSLGLYSIALSDTIALLERFPRRSIHASISPLSYHLQ